jgi:hypothetical protein
MGDGRPSRYPIRMHISKCSFIQKSVVANCLAKCSCLCDDAGGEDAGEQSPDSLECAPKLKHKRTDTMTVKIHATHWLALAHGNQ